MISSKKDFFLLGVDLEDNERHYGIKGKTRFRQATRLLLEFLDENNIKTTFFILGETANENKDIIRSIISSDHEIGCHTHDHTSLNQLSEKSFRENLIKNIDILTDLGAKDIYGFRAPRFSLVKDTLWVYDVLEELGFKYSSSVMPTNMSEYSWKDFGSKPKKISGIWEIPLSTYNFGLFSLPLGGIYFRILPRFFIKNFSTLELPLSFYIHPYDFDYNAPIKKLRDSNFLNYLIYYGRESTIPKIKLLSKKYSYFKYIDFIKLLTK